jgi:hypothetical protein
MIHRGKIETDSILAPLEDENQKGNDQTAASCLLNREMTASYLPLLYRKEFPSVLSVWILPLV